MKKGIENSILKLFKEKMLIINKCKKMQNFIGNKKYLN